MFFCLAGKQDWVAPLIIMGYITLVPLWVYIAQKNKQTREVLYSGWTPVVLAMMISRYYNNPFPIEYSRI